MYLTVFISGEDKWGRYDVSNQVIESRNEYFGLWKRCIYVSTGNFDCDNYDNYVLGSMPHMVAARGMVILGLGILPIAIILGLFAMDCTTMMHSKKAQIVTGVVGTLGGLCFCKLFHKKCVLIKLSDDFNHDDRDSDEKYQQSVLHVRHARCSAK